MPENSPKILVVEDEKPLAHALELKLKHAGFEPKLSYNGEDALKILEEEKFEVILLDLVLPKKDGFSVLAELKNRGNKTPVIVMSNLSQEEDAKRAKELGATEYYIKSNVPIAKLVESVKKLLKMKNPAEIQNP